MNNQMNILKEKYAFHDGNVDNIQIENNNILIEFELLNFENNEPENIIVTFYEYCNLINEGSILNNWNVSSGTILNYLFKNNFIKLFLEIDNFETKYKDYLTISFNFKEMVYQIPPHWK